MRIFIIHFVDITAGYLGQLCARSTLRVSCAYSQRGLTDPFQP